MRGLSHDFYVQPMNQVYIEAIAIYLFWTVTMLFFSKKARRIVSCIAAACAVGLIFMFTIFGRGGKSVAVSLIPFISFIEAKTQPELYRTMFMNMLLFLPLGLCLPFALPDKLRHKALISILSGLILSVCVETAQAVFCLGKCETDDVLMNTLGTLIGVTLFLINTMFVNCSVKHSC